MRGGPEAKYIREKRSDKHLKHLLKTKIMVNFPILG